MTGWSLQYEDWWGDKTERPYRGDRRSWERLEEKENKPTMRNNTSHMFKSRVVLTFENLQS